MTLLPLFLSPPAIRGDRERRRKPAETRPPVNFVRTLAVAAILLLMCLIGCREHIADTPTAVQPPNTFLWLFPDGDVATGVSRTRLHWWGECQNGIVQGYLFAFRVVPAGAAPSSRLDTMRYTWTAKNDTTILFPLDTLFRSFEVVVRGVNNTFGGLPEQSTVRFSPFPFWDKNDNGLFDGADVRLDDLAAATDPVGAVRTFPVRNSPPSVFFAQNPIDPSLPLKQPDTTYTAATFAWSATDPDGNNTLVYYRIALNDTTNPANWLTVPLRDTVVTLVVPRLRSDAAGATITADVYAGSFLGRQLIGQLPGLKLDALNKLYLEVRDVAGEYSPVVTLPSGNDHWFVKRPRAKLLLVSDYVNSDAPAALSTYLSSLTAVRSGLFTAVDQLNIGLGVTLSDKSSGRVGTLVPPFVDPALIQTFLQYDYVLWYTDQYPSLGVAQLSLFTVHPERRQGPLLHVVLNTIDPRGAFRDFAPIDSVSSVDLSPTRPLPVAGDTRIPAGYSWSPTAPTPPISIRSWPSTPRRSTT